MNPKLKFLLFIVSLVALLVFQSKAVMPFVYDVVSSDLFLEESDDQGSQMKISNDMTHLAFTHCNTYIKGDSDFSINFPKEPINAWSMGNHQYVVNADIEIIPADGVSFTRRYACHINYTEQDDLSVANNFDNWSVKGLSGLNDLD